MKIPASKLVHGLEYPIWVLEFLRCPDGIYGIVVARNPRTVQERIPQPLALSQIIFDEDWFKEEEKVEEVVVKPEKKVLVENKPATTSTKKSTTAKKKTTSNE